MVREYVEHHQSIIHAAPAESCDPTLSFRHRRVPALKRKCQHFDAPDHFPLKRWLRPHCLALENRPAGKTTSNFLNVLLCVTAINTEVCATPSTHARSSH
jgi:hypothetical protein